MNLYKLFWFLISQEAGYCNFERGKAKSLSEERKPEEKAPIGSDKSNQVKWFKMDNFLLYFFFSTVMGYIKSNGSLWWLLLLDHLSTWSSFIFCPSFIFWKAKIGNQM